MTDGPTGPALAAGLLSSTAAGTLFAWSVVSAQVADELGTDAVGASRAFSVALAAFTGTVLLTGPAADRTSCRQLLLLAAGLCGTGLSVAAGADRLAVLTAGVGGLFAAGSGVAYLVALRLASRGGPATRGRVLGVVVGGYAATPIMLGAVGPAAVDAVGWRVSLVVLALTVTGMLAAAAAVCPGRRGPGDGGPPPATVSGSVAVQAALWLVFAFGSAPALAAFGHAVQMGRALGLAPTQAGIALVALATGNLAGRLVSGLLARVRGTLTGIGACVIVTVTSLSTLVSLDGTWWTAGALFALGAGYGALSALVPLATAEVVPHESFGRVYGRVFTGWGAAGLVAPLAAGGLATAASYDLVLLGGVGSALVAAGALVALARVVGPGGPSS